MSKVIQGDWLNNNIPDKSIDVIMADPPYYNIKGDFDFIWDSFEDYLKDVEKWAIECKRVLKDNGSLFWWGDAKNIAYSQIILDKYFNLGNSLVWEKNECKTKANDYTQARYFTPVTERCLFYSNEVERSGLDEINNNLELYKPIRDYFKNERLKTNCTYKQINEECFGTASNGGGMASNILTSYKDGWSFPVKDLYVKLQSIGICQRPYEELRAEYEELRAEYEELRAEYEELRRPFNNDLKLNDVIHHSQEAHITKLYDHETKKPLGLIKKLLQTTTTPKHNKVLIPFGGSGTDVEACIDLGLNYECYEIDPKHYETIKKREKECLKQPNLLFI